MSVLLNEYQLKHIRELDEADAGDPCKGVWANSLLYGFNVGDPTEQDEFVRHNWERLAGKRLADGRRLAEEMRRGKPEEWQMRLTRFGKTAPVVRERRVG